MPRIIFGICLFVLCGISVAGQADHPAKDPGIQTIELYSPWVIKDSRTVGWDPELRKKRCLNFVLLDQTCWAGMSISYGDRIGDNWDIFDFSAGPMSQSRMVNIGRHDWTDEFTLSPIEPLPKLAPGETRAITIALYGSDGKPGMNGDGTYPKVFIREGNGNKPLDQQVHATITMSGKPVRSDGYVPLSEAKKGDMYLLRVIDPKHDFYVLMRVDDLVRGTKVTLSYWKWDPSKPIF